MNRNEAIKLIDTAQALGSANGWNMLDKLLWLVDAVEAKALAMPKADAERVALMRDDMKRNDLMCRIDEVSDGENVEILLRDIRAYLTGGAE